MYFSIVIPCYNNQTTLSRTLDSVLAQRHVLKEIILIDDGSTDKTAEIAQCYAKQYPKYIRYHHQSNSGPAIARNQGARLAEGEYTLFLDGDDTLYDKALEAFHLAFQQKPECQILIAGYCAVHETYAKERFIKAYPDRDQLLKGIWFGEFSINGGMVAIKTPLLRITHYPETIRHGEDIVFFSHLIAQYETDILPFISVNIYHHPDSLRHQKASILKDQDALVSLLFNPHILPASLMALQPAFHAHKLISLARTALNINDKPLARRFLKQAFSLHPASFFSITPLKTFVKTW